MFAFFVLFTACYVILSTLIRLGSTKLAGTQFGAALAYLHS